MTQVPWLCIHKYTASLSLGVPQLSNLKAPLCGSGVTSLVSNLPLLTSYDFAMLLQEVWAPDYCTTIDNKKVLPRVRKRHTACHVASTHHAVPLGYLPPILIWDLDGGTPSQIRIGGTLGYPCSFPILTWDLTWTPSCWWRGTPGYPPTCDEVPHILTWDGDAHPLLGRIGVPPPWCELTHKLKLLPSPILWMWAVIIPWRGL